MSPDLLSEYLGSVEACMRKLKDVYVERYEEEFITNARINLRIRIRFMTGHLLEINEAVVAEENKTGSLPADSFLLVEFAVNSEQHHPFFQLGAPDNGTAVIHHDQGGGKDFGFVFVYFKMKSGLVSFKFIQFQC